MYKFGKRSLDNLVGVHPYLVQAVHDVMALQVMDFSVVDGLRSIEQQKKLYDKGYSKTMNSKHLRQSDGFGHAVDLYPYPIDMNRVNAGNSTELVRFGVLSGLMVSCARNNGVIIKWGADWDMDGKTLDHSFTDMPHFELVL